MLSSLRPLTGFRAIRPTFSLSPAICSPPARASGQSQSRSFDTTSDFAETIFANLGVAAKLERRRILERTARGRGRRQGKGASNSGRKPMLTPHQQKEACKRLEAGETQRSVARSYNVSQSTISRLAA
jgi:DNA invertase Pin-like site-specific DNA recombinase